LDCENALYKSLELPQHDVLLGYFKRDAAARCDNNPNAEAVSSALPCPCYERPSLNRPLSCQYWHCTWSINLIKGQPGLTGAEDGILDG